jgi:hypothetical protein
MILCVYIYIYVLMNIDHKNLSVYGGLWGFGVGFK